MTYRMGLTQRRYQCILYRRWLRLTLDALTTLRLN